MKIVFFGDVFGKSGRETLLDAMPKLKDRYQADFYILNAENLADGKGLTEKTARPLFNAGIDAMTGGNHLWDRPESLDYIRSEPRIIKPLNYPRTTPGSPYCTIVKHDLKLTVLCLTGQLFMPPCDSPFSTFDRYLPELSSTTPCILLDLHGESTAEKRAMGWHVDGMISALIGTHTHIQTADEEILPQGTAYITDAGMTGPHDSVIGVKRHIILEKMRSGIPVRYEVSDRGPQINGIFITLDHHTGRALQIERIRECYKDDL
ncbi:MAG: TIGR00282 family metallophosphoesterase [Candidatus Cloacimonetes bacterium]|nr:TIGR00282 family metallophosphoesterase [Candidatus Cloacimonadota bacterium]